jgi:hypothetical protein
MKNFVKDNWYKLMIGSSMMMASFGFMIYAISPAYSNSDKEKTEFKNPEISNFTFGNNGVNVDGILYFVDGGYVYRWNGWDWTETENWKKSKLP